MLSLLPLFEWCDRLAMSDAYRASLWLFPVTQSLHLVALAVFIGAVLVVDLRLLGWVFRQVPRVHITRGAQPWLTWGFVGLVVTGVPQFTSQALRYYDSPIFAFKMGLLAVALLYTFTLRRRVALADEAGVGSGVARTVGLVSILLWTGVTVSGRAIGFY